MKNNDFNNRVKLLIKYNLSKTSKENEFLLEQEPYSRFETQTNKDLMKQGELEGKENKEKEDPEKYPNYCKYKDKAVGISEENCGGIKSKDGNIKKEDGNIKKWCRYAVPRIGQHSRTVSKRLSTTSYTIAKEEKLSDVESYFFPNDADIIFRDEQNILQFALKIIEKYPKWYESNIDKENLFRNLSKILPTQSVSQVTLKNGQVFSTMLKYNRGLNEWEFIGLFTDNERPYPNPDCDDIRTEYQKFVDEWGMALQFTAVLATAILAGLTGTVTGGATWVLWFEIATEMGLGVMTGYRELEKGENVSAAISFITGTLPFLKLSKVLRGVNEKDLISLSEKLKIANLTTNTTEAEYLIFYESLKDGEKTILTQLLKHDDVSRGNLIKLIKTGVQDDLPKVIIKEIEEVLKKNPGYFKDLKIFQRLWARELSSNAFVLLIGLVVEQTLGQKLNSSQLQDFQNVYFNIPTELREEATYNFLYNAHLLPAIIEGNDFQALKTAINVEKTTENYEKKMNTFLKASIENPGGTYIELTNNPTKSDEIIKQGETSEEKLRKEGWITKEELGDREEENRKYFNGKYWYKVKN